LEFNFNFCGNTWFKEFQYRFRRAWPVIKAQLDEDSGTGFQWLPWAYSGFSFFTYVMLFLVIFDFINILPFKVLLIVITMHIASGIWMFLRMVRH